MNRYDCYGLELIDSLLSHVNKDGKIVDPFTRQETPRDHYAYTHLCSALIKAYEKTNNKKYLKYTEKLLRQYFSIKEKNKGHNEFNLLALAEINEYSHLLSENIQSKLINQIRNPRFTTSKEVPRNWIALRILFYKYVDIQGLDVKTPTDQSSLWFEWIEDGLFVDFESEQFKEIPLTYHSMHTALILEYCNLWEDQHLREVGLTALEKICEFIMSDGETLYWGRSNNSLFGYIHLLYALEIGIQFRPDEFTYYRDLINEYIQSLSINGEFMLNSGSSSDNSVGWDGYMYHSVYNSNAANMFLKMPYKQGQNNPKKKLHDTENKKFLIKRSGPETAVNLLGQTRHGSRDPRGTGFVPLTFKTSSGLDAIPTLPLSPSPTRVPLDFIPISPFLPIIKIKGQAFTPMYWDLNSVGKMSNNLSHASGQGIFTKNPSSLGRSAYSKISSFEKVGSLLYKLGGGNIMDRFRRPRENLEVSLNRSIVIGTINDKEVLIIWDDYKNISTVDEIYPYSFPFFHGEEISIHGNNIKSSRWNAVLGSAATDTFQFEKYETSKGYSDIVLIKCQSSYREECSFGHVFSSQDINCDFYGDNQDVFVELGDQEVKLPRGNADIDA